MSDSLCVSFSLCYLFGVHQACNHAFHRHCIIKCVDFSVTLPHSRESQFKG
ncbi:hypothetical protein PRUPE_6G304000 [Prunus persica]|uniref:Anaphase-promoting complex subunit 11 RING-H2 finger domain-containing protein n=1 Tax=Prunus persica TaxID=3760 RepID=A0A251NXW0_PRUPE|nr:hypothetical protein PRUPE_6G304000 [Prunus persica]